MRAWGRRPGGWHRGAALLAGALAGVLAAAVPRAAWTQESNAAEELPPQLYAWTAPPVAEQLANDETPMPAGAGAIFVPCLSDPSEEPEALVFDGDTRVASGPTGSRIPVAPGVYTVRVGSGTVQQTVAVEGVTVAAGDTTVVRPVWGGLRIDVVDENNLPHRGSYELIRMDDRALFGLGFGADTLQGERLSTWLLAPALYRIVQPGASYRSRSNFSTVYVPPGGLVHYKLVLDPDTGEFRGAGVVTPDELGVAEGVSAWSKRLVLGLNAGLSQTSNVVGLPDQITSTSDLFLDLYVTYDHPPHLFAAIFEDEEGVSLRTAQGELLPVQKSLDRLRMDLLYTYFLNADLGPYVRLGTTVSFFPTTELVTTETTVVRTFADGHQATQVVAPSHTYRVGGAFSPIELREGTGLNLRVLSSSFASVAFRIGLGFRQSFFDDAFREDDLASTPELELAQIEDLIQEGVESVMAGTLRLTRFLTFTSELEGFADFSNLNEFNVDWQSTLSFRLAAYLAIDYTLGLVDHPDISQDLQLSQNVLFRLSWETH